MKEIQLSQGKIALVDDEDYEELSKYKWHAVKCKKNWYAVRTVGKTIHVQMHRQIMDAPKEILVDHINRDGLDNRKENMRFATQKENLRNRGPNQNNLSGYKGIRWRSREKKWESFIGYNGEYVYLGMSLTKEEAALAYNKAALELHGEFAYLNIVPGLSS